MNVAWPKRISPWRVLTWAAIAILLVLVILDSRKPSLNDVLGSAVIPLIVTPIVILVDEYRRGRSVPRSIGHAALSVVVLVAIFATFSVLQVMFGRPRDVDPFSESVDPTRRVVAAILIGVLAWAEIARQFHFGPFSRNGDR